MTVSNLDMSSDTAPAFPPIMPGKLILNGENPFIRLAHNPDGNFSSDASLWSITYSSCGAGHALFIKSELTDGQWRIYTDNPALVSWLQKTVQGMLNPETANSDIEVISAQFSQSGDLQQRWIQVVRSESDEISLSWSYLQEPLLMAHEHPAHLPARRYGVSVVMIPAQEAELVINGTKAAGQIWPCRYDGKPFSTAALAFSESWREAV